ncbi:transposase [Caldifermentibacillus hisashii]|uniref:transposase n=1 Tax=Caldifermentibacillus hisashii TaxID=996558 RepID=UPI0031FBDD1A
MSKGHQFRKTTSKTSRKKEASEQNEVEGKFDTGKRSYSLGLIRVCLEETSETVVCLQFLVMNLEQKLKELLHHIFTE